MMEKIDGGNFDEIEKIITPRNFQKCESNYLRVAMEVWISILRWLKPVSTIPTNCTPNSYVMVACDDVNFSFSLGVSREYLT